MVGSTTRGETEYILRGNQIAHLKRVGVVPGDEAEMHFYYDVQGKAAMVSYNGSDYWYVYNLQGDVVALLDKTDNVEVVAYEYDAWGKQVSCTGVLADALGKENPFRYRGYVLDEETELYSLSVRYYNPKWGRFSNADLVLGSVGQLFTHDVFSYCYNNPTNLHDPSGMTPQWNDPKYIAAMEAHGRRQLAAMAANTGKVKQFSTKTVHDLGLKPQTVTLTDLKTGRTLDIQWQPPGDEYHSEYAPKTGADTKIAEDILSESQIVGFQDNKAWNERPGFITFGNGLSIAVGFHLRLHLTTLAGGDPGLTYVSRGSVEAARAAGIPDPVGGHADMYYGDSAGGGDVLGPRYNNAAFEAYNWR